MDTMQKQLNALSGKVDDLHQLIEQLGTRVSDIVTECKLNPGHTHHSDVEALVGQRYSRSSFRLDPTMEHKDVLVDGDSLDASMQSNERQLTPEIQIQRLTAQLTAAYGRIAALEEQLIATRIH
jgi:hypothetical protein